MPCEKKKKEMISVKFFSLVEINKRTGNKMPSVERARAPTNEIKMSKFGMATAIITEIIDHYKIND